MCLSQKKSNRLSEKDERHLHDSFAKKIKEIKRWKQ